MESILFPKESGRPKSRTEPDWNTIYQESKRKNVTLQLLWIEYKSQHADGFQYSQFCERFNQWKQKLQLSLRQEHKAGEKLFIDYAGDTVTVIDAETGQMKQAQLFVATLGASSSTPTWRRNGDKICSPSLTVMSVLFSTSVVHRSYLSQII